VSAPRIWEALPPPLRAALAACATVVTPNNRIARRLAALHDEAQRAAGRTAWSVPTVVPWNAWVEHLWQDVMAADVGGDLPRPIGTAASAYLWERMVADDAPPLIDARGAASLAAEAWSLVHAWGTGGPSWRSWADDGGDWVAFARWADRYSGILARTHIADDAQLPDRLVRFLPIVAGLRGKPVTLAGFLEFTPQQERLLAAAAAAGMDIGRSPTVPAIRRDARADTWRAAAATPRDEVAWALQWARDRALADPGAAIGIAIADLGSRREEIRALAEEILCPGLQWPGRAEAPRPYSLSLGAAAEDVPLIAAALDVIALAHAPLPMGRAAALLRSPYVAATPDDWRRWGRLEADWLRQGRKTISLDATIAEVGALDPAFASRWRAARDRQPMPASATPREWTEVWRGWLAGAGWPGERALSSAEWQARGAWDDVLSQFAALAAVAARISRAEALGALTALAKGRVFQPESPQAPVALLGLLEAAGLPLDALWISGLAAESWPAAPRLHPLLAPAWQRERSVPHSTAARELAYAQALTAQWAGGAPHVVFSYARTADDHPRSASALLPDLPRLPERATPWTSTARGQFDAAPRAETLADDRAPALAAGHPVAGGAGLIEAQSDCPFRAMTLYRLEADAWPGELDGLSPMERGSLVHGALAAFWRSAGDHATFAAFPQDELDRRIAVAVGAAMTTLPAARWRRLPAIVQAGEAARIGTLVRTWLERFERARPPFAVAGVEVSRPLELGGLGLRLRLDRIDAPADGGVTIIDYKTGIAKSPGRWFDARPQAPQLGLYALAQRAFAPAQPVRALAYAQLKTGEIRVQGIAADPDAWPGLPGPTVVGGAELADWRAAEDRLAQSLTALAVEIREGRAAVAPRDAAKTCRNCGLQPLCRIGALAEEARVENGDE